MGIDGALILSAGLGTRMGEIGKYLPKVLWPIFKKECLLLQIAYCKELGIKNIYINTHFHAEKIMTFLNEHDFAEEVKVLYENPLLDSGGAIHNLARQKEISYQGNFLLINGDQFLFFDKIFWEKALNKLPEGRAVLFGIIANKNEKYNETVCEHGVLKSIQKPNGISEFTTYSGLGLIRLNELLPVPGVSKFFETVANYRNEKIYMVVPDLAEYWDFGTANVYFDNIKKLNELNELKKQNLMLSFLKRNNAISTTGADQMNDYISKELNSIDLMFRGHFVSNSICYDRIIMPLF